MAWTAPMTATANTAFTAAQFNTYVRDNLNETAPAKATASGRFFAATGANAIAERVPSANTVATSQTTTSTSYTDLATVGPTVTVTTGTAALIILGCRISNSGANLTSMSVDISSATTVAASDTRALQTTQIAAVRATADQIYTSLTAGSNVFRAKYKVAAGTGTFVDRDMCVIPF